MERLHHLKALENTRLFLAGRRLKLLAQLLGECLHIDFREQLLNGLRTHTGAEFVFILFAHIRIFFFAQGLHLLQRRVAGIDHDIKSKIQDFFQNAGRDIQHQAHAGRDTLKIPDMRNRRRQLDMAHALAADLILRDLNTATFANFPLITDAFIFSTMAFPVLCGAKNALTKQAVTLGLQGAVIDCFRLLDLAIGPFADLIRRCKTDFDGFKGDIFHGKITCLSFWFHAGKWGAKPN